MNFIKYITAILLSLQPPFADKETWEDRSARMEIVAVAIDDASSKSTCTEKYDTKDCTKIWPGEKKDLALLLVTQGYFESKFAKNVHEGKCKPYECDSYRKNGAVIHRARSLWQIQKTNLVTREEYTKMKSSSQESTTLSANVAVRYLLTGMKSCKTIRGALAVYTGAKSCTWSGIAPREAFYKKISGMSDEQVFAAADAREMKYRAKTDATFIKNNKDKKEKK